MLADRLPQLSPVDAPVEDLQGGLGTAQDDLDARKARSHRRSRRWNVATAGWCRVAKTAALAPYGGARLQELRGKAACRMVMGG